jgi:hypothetical protein
MSRRGQGEEVLSWSSRAMALTSEELNYLLYRYLLESGAFWWLSTPCPRADLCTHARLESALTL